MMLFLSMLKTKNQPSIQMKILGLIKKWGEKFATYKSTVPNFTEVYQNLIRSGVVFPNDFSSTYFQYLPKMQPQSQPSNNYSNDFGSNEYDNDFNSNANKGQSNEGGFDYAENIKYSLVPSKYEPKYTKLVNYLGTLVESIQLANEMIDSSRPGNVDDSLHEIMVTLREGNNKLIETISSDRLRNEKLMDLTIAIDEDINRTMNRYENLRNRSKPEPFLSSFVEKNAMNDIPMRQKSKKSNNPPSNINIQNNPQPKLNVQPDPSVKSVDDIFDIFSNPKPNNNIGGDHPLDLFDVSQPVVPMNMNQNPNMNIMPQPQIQQQPQPQKVDPTTDLQNKLKMIYENPQNNNNNMQQGMYPNLSGIGPNVMMNNQPNPMGIPMNNPNPMGMPMNQPNLNPIGMPMNQPNPLGMPMNNPNLMGMQMNNPNPIDIPMNQPNPMGMQMNQPNPIGVPMSEPNQMNQPNPYSGIGMQQNNNMGMNQSMNPLQSSNVPAPVNPQQGSVLQYPSMSGIDGMNQNSNMQPPMNNPSDQAKLNAIDNLF